jgi:uncharacterized phage-associated protein
LNLRSTRIVIFNYFYDLNKRQKFIVMYDINDVCDFVILRANADEVIPLSNLKLQKLLFYIQAWHLAFYKEPFFKGKFQAWVHGPVNREIYERFREKKWLYSDITKSDVLRSDPETSFAVADIDHMNNVLEVYLRFTGMQLESLTHSEEPWIQTRKGYSPFALCEKEIDEELMKDFYKSIADRDEETTKN